MLSSASLASEGRQLWHSRDQFVALEQQNTRSTGTVQPNNHPVEIPPDRLTALLASIEFSSAESVKPEQLLLSESLEVLVPHMVQGFRKAAPGEDVTFAIIGLHKSSLGFARNPKVTTGRAFYRDGRLNIIFGFAQKDFNDREDRRLAPLTPGKRDEALDGEWKLLPQPGRNGYTLVRKDWVTFSDAWRAAVAPPPLATHNTPSAQPIPAQPVKQTIDTRKPAERLATLNELKEKGLITPEEYRAKRQEILNEL
jgi:FAD/FMN-containing dehydrogenase